MVGGSLWDKNYRLIYYNNMSKQDSSNLMQLISSLISFNLEISNYVKVDGWLLLDKCLIVYISSGYWFFF
jgi:hypothetical protein